MKYWNEKEKKLMTEKEMAEANRAQQTEKEAPADEPSKELTPGEEKEQTPAEEEKPKTSKGKK